MRGFRKSSRPGEYFIPQECVRNPDCVDREILKENIVTMDWKSLKNVNDRCTIIDEYTLIVDAMT